jgi:hypothetical protein
MKSHMPTSVTREQFVVTAEGVTHLPTGAKFTPHPDSPGSGNMHLGQLGSRSKSGEYHRPEQVQAMMRRLWAEYVADNPYAFKRQNGPIIADSASTPEPVKKTYSRRFLPHWQK